MWLSIVFGFTVGNGLRLIIVFGFTVGNGFRKYPICSSNMLCSNLMDIAGEMLATSIVHCGFGFPIFATFVYQYISAGTLETTPHLLQLDDITNFDVRQICEMVVIFF